MYENLKGKRLLFLGAIRALCEPVKMAKELGIYTIVIDYLPDSPAKKVADKSYLVSTTDVDAVVELCRKERVDGLFTAFTDSMLPYARQICDRLSLPFYASSDQIKLSLDKRYFKQTCQKFGVPVAEDYTSVIQKDGVEHANIRFPVIVKPVDSSGGRGIKICSNREEFDSAYKYALSVSPGKTVLVEEYVVGDEVTATYTMKNGEISLSCVKDKLLSKDHKNITSQSDVLIAPSRHLNSYLKNVNPRVIKMLQGLKATDGSVFFQGIATDDRIVFFECGYRVNGGCDYRLIERENGINYMKMMLAHALTGDMGGYELTMDNPRFKKITLTFNIFAHGGKIASMCGLEKVLEIPNVSFAEYMHDVGDVLIDNNTLSQRAFRAVIVDESVEEIQRTLEKIQAVVEVCDEQGNSLKYLPFDVRRLDRYKGETV